MNQTPEQKLALEVLTAYVKGTPNRSNYRGKVWEQKIVAACLKAIGATEFFKEHQCSCGSVFAKFGDKAICIACGNESKDYKLLRFHCTDCGKTVSESVWSLKEEQEAFKASEHFCHGWYCK